MKVLVACEESQAVCKAFRQKGHDAFSCDIMPCSGGHPEWHIKGDILNVLNPRIIQCGLNGDYAYFGLYFVTQDGTLWTIMGGWDLIIAHPPCTDLAVSGARHFKKKQADGRQEKSINFFMKFTPKGGCTAPKICIENPVSIMSTKYKKPTQIIQPWQFGESYSKKTCLWLYNLPPLEPTNIVEQGEKDKYGFSKNFSLRYATDENGKILSWKDPRTAKARSKTPEGIANAMAEQWG